MSHAFSGRTLLATLLTTVGLVIAALVAYICVVLIVFNGRIDFASIVSTVVIWRTVALVVVAVVGTRIACGTALGRGVPSAVGATATGMVLAGVIMVALSWGHTLVGQLILEADSARSLIDVVVWSLGGACGLFWAQLRTTTSSPRSASTAARAPSWS